MAAFEGSPWKGTREGTLRGSRKTKAPEAARGRSFCVERQSGGVLVAARGDAPGLTS